MDFFFRNLGVEALFISRETIEAERVKYKV
jgi:hypothetical protein